MRTILRIDGLSNEPVGQISIAPGTSLRDLVRQFGGTIREESAPDLPPELSPGAEDFIRSYQPEEADSVLAVIWRYHSLGAEEFDSAEEAESFLWGGEEWETLAGEAVVVGDQITVWD